MAKPKKKEGFLETIKTIVFALKDCAVARPIRYAISSFSSSPSFPRTSYALKQVKVLLLLKKPRLFTGLLFFI